MITKQITEKQQNYQINVYFHQIFLFPFFSFWSAFLFFFFILHTRLIWKLGERVNEKRIKLTNKIKSILKRKKKIKIRKKSLHLLFEIFTVVVGSIDYFFLFFFLYAHQSSFHTCILKHFVFISCCGLCFFYISFYTNTYLRVIILSMRVFIYSRENKLLLDQLKCT